MSCVTSFRPGIYQYVLQVMGAKNGPDLLGDSRGTEGVVSALGEQTKAMEQHCLLFCLRTVANM